MLGLGGSLSSPTVLSGGIPPYVNEWSVLFDGSNDYIDTGATFQDTFRDSFSISMWMKTPGAVDYKYPFGVKGDSQNAIRPTWVASGYGPSNFLITFEANNRSYATQPSDLPQDTWVHLVWTLQKQGTGSDPTLFHLYVNGSSNNLTAQNSGGGGLTAAHHGAFNAGGNNFTIGKVNNLGWSPHPGRFYQFAIFNTNLSAANAAAMYNSGAPIDLTLDQGDYDKSSNLVSFWKMDEGTGTEAADSKGENPGTLTNGPTWSDNIPS